jgi:two-component system phosphate regulon sensor histidine kinase PhoR
LGLSIAKYLAEAHGGDIRADSVPGQGTKISFTLSAPPA